MGDTTVTKLAGITVTAFRSESPTVTTSVEAELLRHGPALRAAQTPVETEWEARFTLQGEVISGRGDSTWAAMVTARRQLEERGLRLAIAAARRDCAVINVERHRGVTVVSNLADKTDVPGMLAYAAPELVGTVEEQEHAYATWLEQREETR